MERFSKITTCFLIAVALGFTVMSCKKDVEKVEVSPATITLEEGKTAQLNATVTPEKAEYTLAWSSSNPAVATVDNNGKITAIAEGTASIIAEAGGKKGTCVVTVKNVIPPIPDGGIVVTFGNNTWTAGGIQADSENNLVQILANQGGGLAYDNLPMIDIVVDNSVGAIDLTTSGYVEYYETTAISDGTYNYGDWWAIDDDGTYYGSNDPVVNITAFGNGKVSGNFTLTMFNAKEKYVDHNTNFATRDLTVTFQNVDLQTAKKFMNSFYKKPAKGNNLKSTAAVRQYTAAKR
jgi:hypothetical protein